MPVTWVKPKLVCEVKFQEWTQDNSMRHPIFMGLRTDKKPTEVTREQELPVEEVVKKPKKGFRHIFQRQKEGGQQTERQLVMPDGLIQYI